MSLSSLAGQERAVSALRAALDHRAVHHAYLFAGPQGVGKESAALGLAQALTCQEKPWVGCGTCNSCQRVAHRNHPDVSWLMPEDEMVARGFAGRADFANVASKDIRVEQVRVLQERLVLRPLEAPWKIAIIVDADELNAQAQNAFLKTLEEPPRNTTIVLVASAPEKLLPTIQSRCARIQFGPLPTAVIEAKLREEHGIDESTAHLTASLAQGSLSRALGLDPKTMSFRKDLIEKFEKLDFSRTPSLIAFAEEFGQTRDQAAVAIKILQLWLRDLAVSKIGAVTPVNVDLEGALKSGDRKHSVRDLLRFFAESQEALENVEDRNGAPRLNLEKMLIRIGAPA